MRYYRTLFRDPRNEDAFARVKLMDPFGAFGSVDGVKRAKARPKRTQVAPLPLDAAVAANTDALFERPPQPSTPPQQREEQAQVPAQSQHDETDQARAIKDGQSRAPSKTQVPAQQKQPSRRQQDCTEIVSGYCHTNPGCVLLVLTQMTIFAWQIVNGGVVSLESNVAIGPSPTKFHAQGSMRLPPGLAGGAAPANEASSDQAWRLLTAVHLHRGVLHLLAVVALQLALAPPVELAFGAPAMLALHTAGGVAGNAAAAIGAAVGSGSSSGTASTNVGETLPAPPVALALGLGRGMGSGGAVAALGGAVIVLAVWIRKLARANARERASAQEVTRASPSVSQRAAVAPPTGGTASPPLPSAPPGCPAPATFVAFTARWSLLHRRLRLAAPLVIALVLAEVLGYSLALLPTEATSDGSGGVDHMAHVVGLAGGALVACALHPLWREERRHLHAARVPLEYAAGGQAIRLRVCCQYMRLYARVLLFAVACGFAFVFSIALPSACC